MVKRQRASSSSLFLMELIIAIMLFCLASSICILAFVNSHLMHRDSILSNEAVSIVQNTAESIRAARSVREIKSNLNNIYPGSLSGLGDGDLFNEELIIHLDTDFNEASGDSPYYLSLENSQDGRLFCSIITFYKKTTLPDTGEKVDEAVFDLYVEHLVY